MRKAIGRTGKWSMADVFVVATFLFYLSFSYEFRNQHRSKDISGTLLLFSLLYPLYSIFTIN